jgi:hypothetical protein
MAHRAVASCSAANPVAKDIPPLLHRDEQPAGLQRGFSIGL